MKPKDWDQFLQYIADQYQLRGRLRDLFEVRFAYENWRKPDLEIWELAEAPSHETYKKQMTQLYGYFSKQQPSGCPELNPNSKGPGKFDILRGWLRDVLYPQWTASNLTAHQQVVSPSSNGFVYIPRLPVESETMQEILKPGALLRIRAPEKMGKTSLMRELLNQATTYQYNAIYLNLQNAEANLFNNLDRFLRWFAANISRELGLKPLLEDYWDTDLFGSLVSCKSYFQGHILASLKQPLVIGLDNLDRLFDHALIAGDFLPMLRYWHEEAKTQSIWQNLRLVLALSSEIYVKLDIHQSPFNVGRLIKLPGFNLEQMQILAQSYHLNLINDHPKFAKNLLDLVGGHPYLIRLAFETISTSSTAPEELLLEAATQGGIYGEYLRRLWERLQLDPNLITAFSLVINSTEGVVLEPDLTYKLESMGLITLIGDKVEVSCQIYRQYFQDRI